MHLIETALLDSFNSSFVVEKNFPSVIIAYSGGLDSSVLLHAAYQLKKQGKISKLSAAHANHGLQQQANNWQVHCQKICDDYQILLQTQSLNLSEKKQFSEADARDARYKFFAQLVEQGQAMVFAHHLDDQAETLLFRLFRGTGVHGMTGIADSRKLSNGHALRPLLKFPKQDLLDYAKQYDLKWIEDPSNKTSEYHRNFIRNEVLPLIRTKWSSVSQSIVQFSNIAKYQVEILDEVAEKDLSDFKADEECLCLKKIANLSVARQNNLLHFWIKKLTLFSPSASEINEVLKQLGVSSQDKNIVDKSIKIKAANGWIRSYNQRLYFCPKDEPKAIAENIVWGDLNKNLDLGNGLMISCQYSENNLSDGTFDNLQVRKPKDNETVTVRARVGGEVAHPCYRQHSTELKKIYQELQIPPWKRKWLPLVFYNDQVVVVPGVFVDKSMQVEQSGLCLVVEATTPALF